MIPSKAIRLGLLWVNGPVLLLLFGPALVFSRLASRGIIAHSHLWLGAPVFLAGFIMAWLWWSLSVPRWRLWAYERVGDIAALKAEAVRVGLTWPDDSPFTRTEIKSQQQRQRERDYEAGQ